MTPSSAIPARRRTGTVPDSHPGFVPPSSMYINVWIEPRTTLVYSTCVSSIRRSSHQVIFLLRRPRVIGPVHINAKLSRNDEECRTDGNLKNEGDKNEDKDEEDPFLSIDEQSDSASEDPLSTTSAVLRGAAVRYRMRISYDGTGYRGWQAQGDRKDTIQSTIEYHLTKRISGHKHIRVVGSSRTDTGVHTKGQAAHFDLDSSRAVRDNLAPSNFTPEHFRRLEFQINQMLPGDISVSGLQLAPPPQLAPVFVPNSTPNSLNNHTMKLRPWHAIYSSTSKLYRYQFKTSPKMDPLLRHYWHHEYRPIDLGLLEESLRQFIGTHDFTSFSNRNDHGRAAKNPVRTIYDIQLHRAGAGAGVGASIHGNDSDLYYVDFRLNGALYKMVRNIMGTCLSVSCGEISLDDIQRIFAARNRGVCPKSAPARGLCLEKVWFEPEDSW